MSQPEQQITRVAAYGLVLEGDRIVLCRLSQDVPGHPGAWTLPGGGLDFGEDPALAMVREVHEETGLDVRPTGVLSVDSIRMDRDGIPRHGIRIIYSTELLGGELRNEVAGSTDLCAWHREEAARALPLVDLASIGLDLAFASTPRRQSDR